MKEKPNYAELEKQIDFKAVAGRLDKLTEKDNRQRTTLVTLLDNLKEQLLEARQKRNVSYHTLAKELTDAGLKVSEPTLRKYMQAQGVGKKNRKKGRKARSNGHAHPTATAESQTPDAATVPAQGGRKHRYSLNI
jgi:ribosome-binding protein aMBF1 (putative translation factor)